MDIELISKPRENENISRLLPELTTITREAFGTSMTEDDVAHHVLDAGLLCLIRENGDLIGFSSQSSYEHKGKQILHFVGTAIRRSSQGKGVYNLVKRAVIEALHPSHVVMRTQNPVIYSAASRLVQEVYPNTGSTPQEIEALARTIGGGSMGKDLVIRGCYGMTLYNKIPDHRTAKPFFDEHLKMNYDRGDAVIIVGAV